MAEEYGWPADVVGDLTDDQLVMYLTKKNPDKAEAEARRGPMIPMAEAREIYRKERENVRDRPPVRDDDGVGSRTNKRSHPSKRTNRKINKIFANAGSRR